jgi:hypothetical protein
MKIEVRGTSAADLAEALRRAWLPRAVWTRSPGDGDVVVCTDQVCLAPIHSADEWMAAFSSSKNG